MRERLRAFDRKRAGELARLSVARLTLHRRFRERLDRTQMLEVGGGDYEWCMRILRHEAGHVIENAYKLRLRRQRAPVVRPLV